jgi:hypothetical protein
MSFNMPAMAAKLIDWDSCANASPLQMMPGLFKQGHDS